MSIFLAVILGLFILAPVPAFAYLGMGTTSMIIQIIIGSTAGLLVLGKLYWHKLVSLFSRTKAPESSEDKDLN